MGRAELRHFRNVKRYEDTTHLRLPILNNPFEMIKIRIIKIRVNQFDNRISDYVSFIRFVSYSNDRWRLIDKRV